MAKNGRISPPKAAEESSRVEYMLHRSTNFLETMHRDSVCEDLVQCRLQLSSPIVAFSITDRPIALTYHANSV